MTDPASSASRISPLGILRCVGLGLATAQLVYLVLWIALVLGPRGEAPPILAFLGRQPLDSLAGLAAGMIWAAFFGAIGGLAAGAGYSLVAVRTRP